ncbi:drug/metabolite transporter DMT permease [Salmonella enterica subsp. enterica]|uniref:Drug/metabolite transporter DMT permease n=1 Tax=Salmonella enterica I TaxID=59201 RepID=A0A3S4LXH4_SALET|nr:drug/metabolite transporter DMT permease [Salmonella enterica subsp. enterica]
MVKKKKTLLFPPGQRLFQFVICIFYFCIPFSLMIYGETYVNSGLAAIIFANMPCGRFDSIGFVSK